jgi:hypothetical protein
MTGVAVEMLFSVLEDGPEGAWPRVGPLGTGCRPPTLPLEHGCSLVVAGDSPLLPAAALAPAAPAILLLGRPVRRVMGVSANPR